MLIPIGPDMPIAADPFAAPDTEPGPAIITARSCDEHCHLVRRHLTERHTPRRAAYELLDRP